MAVHKRGKVWHYEFELNGQRFRGSTRQTRKDAAERVEATARERAALGSILEPEIPTLEQAAGQWFSSRAADLKSVKTVAQRLKIMLPLIGPDKLVTEIRTRDVEVALLARKAQVTHRKLPPTNSTCNRDIIDSTLRPILNHCAEVLELPVHRIAWKKVKLKEPKERDRKFTTDEIATWRAGLPVWHQPLFDFFQTYGPRLKEAFFPPKAVDLDTGRVFLRKRKNGREHTIRLLPDDLAAMRLRHGIATRAGLNTVWYKVEDDGSVTPIHWRAFASASKIALERAGIEDARPVHDLRHHAATTLVGRTGNLKAAQRLLGHESIQSTMRYAHSDDDDVLEALMVSQSRSPHHPHKDDAKEENPNKIKVG